MTATCAFLVLGLLMVITMFQIAISIQLILREISHSTAITRSILVNIASGVCAMGFVVSAVLLFFSANINAREMYWVYTAFYSFLSVLYTAVMVYIIKMINKLKSREQKNLDREKNSVKKQFWFFLIAFVSRAAFFGIVLMFNPRELRESWTDTFVEAILYIPWNVVPVAMILFEHFRTFRQLGKVNSKQMAAYEAVDDSELDFTVHNKGDGDILVYRKSVQSPSIDSEELELKLNYDAPDNDKESSGFTDGRNSELATKASPKTSPSSKTK